MGTNIDDPLSNREKFPGERNQLCQLLVEALSLWSCAKSKVRSAQCLSRLPLDLLRGIKESLGLYYRVDSMPELSQTSILRVQKFVDQRK